MSEQTLCNDCGSAVKYINTRKEGIIKCQSSSVKAIQNSGRIVEVFLIHECETGTSNKTPGIKTKKRKLWIGPDTLS